MLSCIIIEDQPPAQRILQKYITDIGNLDLIGIFTDALSALEFLKTSRVELIFLDIHLPKISGIDFLSVIPYKPQVILTTAFSDYALQGYELDVVDYLLKPFSFQRFVKAIAKVHSLVSKNLLNFTEQSTMVPPPDFIFIKSGYDHIKIALKDILYVKSESDYTEIYTNTKKHLATYPLKYWSEKLSTFNFCQVHKSYIVNIHCISKISGNQLFLENSSIIPIGRAYKDDFNARYLKGF